MHISAHHIYTLGILWCISSTLQFTFVLINILQIHHVGVQRCTPRFCSLRSVFPPMDENLHDIRPHQTAHPSVCAQKGKEVRFSVMGINQVSLHPRRLRLTSSSTSSKPILSTWTTVASRSATSAICSRTVGSIRSTILDGVCRTTISLDPSDPIVAHLSFASFVFRV